MDCNIETYWYGPFKVMVKYLNIFKVGIELKAIS